MVVIDQRLLKQWPVPRFQHHAAIEHPLSIGKIAVTHVAAHEQRRQRFRAKDFARSQGKLIVKIIGY